MIKKQSTFAVLILILFSMNMGIVESQTNKIYVIDLNYEKGNINLINVSVKTGYAPDRRVQPESGHKLEVISFRNEVLQSFKFEVPNTIYPPPPLEGEEPTGPVYLERVNFTLIVLFFGNGKEIHIYDSNNTLKLSIDISEFAECNLNKVCESQENYANCPEDCPSGSRDGYCDGITDGRCDSDCKKEDDRDCHCPNGKCEIGLDENYQNCPEDCEKSKPSTYLDMVVIFIVTLVATFILLFIIWKKFKTQDRRM